MRRKQLDLEGVDGILVQEHPLCKTDKRGSLKPEPLRKATILECPACGYTDVRRSVRRGLLERMLMILRMFPWRCTLCKYRFYAFKRRLNR